MALPFRLPVLVGHATLPRGDGNGFGGDGVSGGGGAVSGGGGAVSEGAEGPFRPGTMANITNGPSGSEAIPLNRAKIINTSYLPGVGIMKANPRSLKDLTVSITSMARETGSTVPWPGLLTVEIWAIDPSESRDGWPTVEAAEELATAMANAGERQPAQGEAE